MLGWTNWFDDWVIFMIVLDADIFVPNFNNFCQQIESKLKNATHNRFSNSKYTYSNFASY